MSKHLAINVAVHPDNTQQMADACEALSRLCAGLAIDGIYCSISFSTFESDEEPNG